jgi:hypothetical protein
MLPHKIKCKMSAKTWRGNNNIKRNKINKEGERELMRKGTEKE